MDETLKGNLGSLVGAEFSKSVPVPIATIAGTFSLVRRYFIQTISSHDHYTLIQL